jgi:hypothetical protein
LDPWSGVELQSGCSSGRRLRGSRTRRCPRLIRPHRS